PPIMAMLRRGDRFEDRLVQAEQRIRQSRLGAGGLRPQISACEDEQVAEDDREGFPPAHVQRREERLLGEERVARQAGLAADIVDGALLRDQRGTLFDESPDRKSTRLNSSHEWI